MRGMVGLAGRKEDDDLLLVIGVFVHVLGQSGNRRCR